MFRSSPHRERTAVGYGNLTVGAASLLGSDKEHTVGSLGTVDRCCGSILQYGYGLYVIRVKEQKARYLDVIHEDKRRRRTLK